MSLKLVTFANNWGAMLAAHAQARGIECHLTDPTLAKFYPGHTLFARLDQKRPEEGRAYALEHIRQGWPCVQSQADLHCYENRAYQFALLDGYYPRTFSAVRTRPTKEQVDEAVRSLGLPIVSKARTGSNSATVRALHSRHEVDRELDEVWGPGISFRSGWQQFQEVFWQAFVHGNSRALRICRVSENWGWMFWVNNRPHDWRASGSGSCKPISAQTFRGDPVLQAAMKTFISMADLVLESRWCAADLLYDKIAGCWIVVDMTLAWNLSRNLPGANFDAEVFHLRSGDPHPAKFHGRDQFTILLDSLEGRE
jgi:hypothetical protein